MVVGGDDDGGGVLKLNLRSNVNANGYENGALNVKWSTRLMVPESLTRSRHKSRV